jgi:hypothetical protein
VSAVAAGSRTWQFLLAEEPARLMATMSIVVSVVSVVCGV